MSKPIVSKTEIENILELKLFQTNTVYSDITEDEAEPELKHEIVYGLLEYLESKGVEVSY